MEPLSETEREQAARQRLMDALVFLGSDPRYSLVTKDLLSAFQRLATLRATR